MNPLGMTVLMNITKPQPDWRESEDYPVPVRRDFFLNRIAYRVVTTVEQWIEKARK